MAHETVRQRNASSTEKSSAECSNWEDCIGSDEKGYVDVCDERPDLNNGGLEENRGETPSGRVFE